MNEYLTQEEITKQLQTLLHKRGKEGLDLARKTILDEKIQSKHKITPMIPHTIVSYVIRARKTVLLDDASNSGDYTTDPYIASHQIRSVLCSPLKFKEAEDKEMIEKGTVYFAPANYHLLISGDKSLALTF